MAIISQIYYMWRDFMDNKSDQRTRDWPLMSSPFPTLFICIFFAYFAKVLGPRLMENRKPFQIRKILIAYNFAQVIFSFVLFYESLAAGWLDGYSLRCQPVDYTPSGQPLRMAKGCWWYFFSKFTEFFDTLFFILRKRNDQVSTLHVIHHGIMPISVWWGVKFIPGGHATFFGMLNTFVHIIMYTYYGLAAIGPQMQKYLWWKKYLTTLQIVQFILVLFHSFQLLFKNDCNFPIIFSYVIMGHAIMFYGLFSHFYKVTYTNKTKKSSTLQKVCNNNNNNSSNNNNNNNNTDATTENNNIPQHQKIANSIACMNTGFYEKMEPVENSYSTTRHRVFVGANDTNSTVEK